MTTTATPTFQSELDNAQPNRLADACRGIALGTTLANLFDNVEVVKTVTQTAAATATLADVVSLSNLRVTAGLNTGRRILSDPSDTASSTVALWDPSTGTVTFETSAAVTGFTYTALLKASTGGQALGATFPG